VSVCVVGGGSGGLKVGWGIEACKRSKGCHYSGAVNGTDK
jgi:hypothetical protein